MDKDRHVSKEGSRSKDKETKISDGQVIEEGITRLRNRLMLNVLR